jgi:nucleoside-diphosphate-sugar epimerase
MLAFARSLEVKRIFYISTVYIRGSYTGIIYEKPVPRPPKFINSYEETKWEAENYVLNASDQGKVTTIIARLSIAVGDEKYIPQNNFGYYNFLSSLYELQRRIVAFPPIIKWALRPLGLKVEGNKIYSTIPFPCIHSKHLNLIPINIVTDFLSRIADHHRSKMRPGIYIYNIADPNPVSLNILFYETLRGIGIHIPIIHTPAYILKLLFRFVAFGAIFFPPARRFSKSLFYYQNYLFNEATYDTRRTEEIIGGNLASLTLLTPDKLAGVIQGFLSHSSK